MSVAPLPSKLAGVILAGGKSSRMGTDKRFMDNHGTSAVHFLFRLLRDAGLEVATSCRLTDGLPDDLHPVFDPEEIKGPMAGIIAGLKAFPGSAVLAVAVDMPGIGPEDIRLLIHERDHTKRATCYFNSSSGQPEPLLTIWEPECLQDLTDQSKKGDFSPMNFLQSASLKTIPSKNPDLFVNLNTPEDLKRWRQGRQP